MKGPLLLLASLLSLGTEAQLLPEIYVTEVGLAGGGIYTVTINQPPAPPGSIWNMAAWGIVNNDAAFGETGLTGWASEVFDAATWDSGIVFETATPGEPIYLFDSGTPGVSGFSDLFGMAAGQAAVYWNESYFGNPLVATSSNFEWSDGARAGVSRGNSTAAFAYISSPEGTLLCQIGVGSPGALDCVPVSVPDADGDGVPDSADNCTLAANPGQQDTDFDGYGNACDPDLNDDGVVNGIDLGLFKQRFFSNDPDADFNSDGVVNPIDLGVMKQLFFGPPGPSAFGF